MRRVYLDHASTTPLDPSVFEAMLPFLREDFGNASSVHALGRKARVAVEESRETVAGLLGAEPSEIIFTSGGTEADNAAIRGILGRSGGGLVTSAAEHEAVLRPAEALQRAGHAVAVLPPGLDGTVTSEQVAEAISEETALVSVMQGNNEVGTLTDVESIVEVCHRRGVPVHCDAVQTAGYGLLRVDDLDVDLASLSGHKMYGTKGVGVLYVRGGVEIDPIVLGGSQERRRRGGTENVAAIVGMAAAFRLAAADAEGRRRHAEAIRARLYSGLQEALGGDFVLNTPLGRSAPHILNIAFEPADGEPVDGEMLLLNLDVEGIFVSSGSACTSGTLEPSHVLLAMGRDRATAGAAVRFSPGKDTSEADVDAAVDAMARVMARMRPQSKSLASG